MFLVVFLACVQYIQIMETRQKIKLSVGVSLAMIAMGAYFPIIDIAVPIVVRMLGYSELVKGIILMVVNGLPLVFYPLFARLSDNSRCRLGRRTPYIYAGIALCTAALIGAAFSATRGKIWLFGGLVTLSSIGIAVYRPAAQSLMPDVIQPSFRSTANSVANVVMGVGNFASIGLVILFGNDYFWIYVIAAIIMAVSVAVYRFFINEPKMVAANAFNSENFFVDGDTPKGKAYLRTLDKSEKINLALILACIFACNFGYTALSATIQNYAVSVWAMTDNLAAVLTISMGVGGAVMILITPFLSHKIGNRITIAISIVIIFAGMLAVNFIKSYTPWIFILCAVYGGGWTALNIVALPSILNFSDIRNNGMFTSIYTITCNLPKAITVLTSSIMINSLGYVSLFPYVLTCIALGGVLITSAILQRREEVTYKI